ncbi:MAG: methyltransferase regulatory domain-containing protein [Gemmatimonadaceae bacterium]
MQDSLRDSYEAAPYESNTIPTTQIGSLQAVAMLHGMRATPADRSRVLELGCASGGNLIPMAYRYPHSEFLGVDFADNQIQDGLREIQNLGATNIELKTMSITDIDDSYGQFDYIICHGVYSWVPPDVQDAILRVCSRNLSPNGVAYISYNVYPGWRQRELLRDALMFHDDRSLPPIARVARARDFAKGLALAAPRPTTVYEAILADESRAAVAQGAAHLFHEQLEPYNAPVYFAEFAARAAGHGLRFVSESKVWLSGWQSEPFVRETLGDSGADPIRTQQYIDFVRGRTFRMTLLCHDTIPVHSAPSAAAIPELFFVGTCTQETPSAEDAAKGDDVVAFRSREVTVTTTNNPIMIGAMRALARVTPRTLSYRELESQVKQRVAVSDVPGLPGGAQGDDEVSRTLPEILLECARGALIDVEAIPSPIVTKVSARPRASAAGRVRAAGRLTIPTLIHGRVTIGAPERFVLSRLDGSRTVADLAAELLSATERGEVTFEGPSVTAETAAKAVSDMLNFFASCALLEA